MSYVLGSLQFQVGCPEKHPGILQRRSVRKKRCLMCLLAYLLHAAGTLYTKNILTFPFLFLTRDLGVSKIYA
jgi:hypothetical protein